ncbi:MAG: hypothetical protein ACYDA8_21735 [Deferrisomatales bacterium]
MVRILFEVSLPAHTLPGVWAVLSPQALGSNLEGRLETFDGGGCQGQAAGGEAAWTPCWVSLQARDPGSPALAEGVRRVREAVVRAAREGGVELLVLPATAQIGDGFYRFRDLLDALEPQG